MNAVYDVLVVGAGPAGSSAAYTLAKHGLKTLLVDKHAFPREKLCGNFVSGMCQNAIGTDLPEDIIRGRVSSSSIQYKYKATVQFPQTAGVFVSRKDLDNFLLERALAVGAEFRPEHRLVKIHNESDGHMCAELSNGETIQSTYIIGADGCRGYTSRYVDGDSFKKWKYAVAYALELPTSDVASPFAEDLCMNVAFMAGGYSWVFNEGNTVNIGAGSSLLFNKRIKTHFREFLKDYLKDETFAESLKLHGKLLPIGGLPRRITRDSVLLAGDAAGAVDAVSGEGIGFAVLSGRLAAEAIAGNIDSMGDACKRYRREFKKTISSELRPVLFYATLLFLFQPIFFSLKPRFSQVLFALQGEAIAGRITHRRFIFKALRLLPGLLIKNLLRTRDA